MPTSTRLFPPYLLAFVAVAALVVVAGSYALPGLHTTKAAMSPDAIAARLAPVAKLEFLPASAATPTLRSGQAVFAGLCVACHGTGVAGAPKVGDKAAWSKRIEQGFDTLVKHATEGYKGMPAKGGDANLDPQELGRAVAWMADQGGASFKEP